MISPLLVAAWPRLAIMIVSVDLSPTFAADSAGVIDTSSAVADDGDAGACCRRNGRRGALAGLQSAGRRRIAANDGAAGLFGSEADRDRPLLPGTDVAKPPAKLPAGDFRRRIGAEVRQSIGHVERRRYVLGRQIAGVGKFDLVGQRARRRLPSPGPRREPPGRAPTTFSSLCRCRPRASGPPAPGRSAGRITWMQILLTPEAGCF